MLWYNVSLQMEQISNEGGAYEVAMVAGSWSTYCVNMTKQERTSSAAQCVLPELASHLDTKRHVGPWI
jgi:hypothetical protein